MKKLIILLVVSIAVVVLVACEPKDLRVIYDTFDELRNPVYVQQTESISPFPTPTLEPTPTLQFSPISPMSREELLWGK